jgi:hypothetical protein
MPRPLVDPIDLRIAPTFGWERVYLFRLLCFFRD